MAENLKQDLASLRRDPADIGGRPRRWLWLLVVVILAAGGGYYALRLRPSLAVIEVETVKASVAAAGQAAAGSPLLTASGYVVARRKAVVSAKIQGRLSELRVEEGSRAREGEVIARLESSDYEASVERAHASVRRAQADLAENQRQLRIAERLAQQNVGSIDARDAAQSRVRIGEAALAQAHGDLSFAEAQLQNTYIRAPFTGVVVKKMAEVGESVAPIPPGVNISTSSGAIVALADLDTLEVEADVAEANVARLGANQPAEVGVEAFPDRRYRAVLRQVIPTADRTKATVQVKVTILDKDRNLKPEMSARVTFLEKAKAKAEAGGRKAGPAARGAPAEPVVTVPAEAIARRNGRAVVFAVEDGRAREIPVVTGAEWRGSTAVKQGLAGSEILVAHPPETLKDGDPVKVKG